MAVVGLRTIWCQHFSPARCSCGKQMAWPLQVPLKVIPHLPGGCEDRGDVPCTFKPCPVNMGVTHTYLLLGRLLGGNPEDTSLEDPKVPEGITVATRNAPLRPPRAMTLACCGVLSVTPDI